ncbi:arylsulfatase B [Aplysia californica]|uniref:Arylsulfatase B n=1 Tax=Aplysia californica TaxID=6500 RepID=A0ABM1AAB2_APLCA|nr:arylsulfatase B [Aplysia californica]
MVDTLVRTAVLTRVLTVLTPVLLSLTSAGCSAAPNIVFVVADDLGWNDVGYHNRDIISPHIDALAKSGVILDQYYVQPLCSPSRSAFMTGYYPFHTGLQHLVIENTQAVCAPLDKLFLPELLRAHNFSTHMVGKWHLGFCKWECTPTYRGFQSFLGYYSADEDYYTKVYPDGFDFRMNKEVYREGVGTYSSFQFADRVDEIVMDHDPKNPLFLYLAFQNVHMPLEVCFFVCHVVTVKHSTIRTLHPTIHTAGSKACLPNNLNCVDRGIITCALKPEQNLSGMVTALDDAVGRLVSVLKRKNLYENTLIIFTSDRICT